MHSDTPLSGCDELSEVAQSCPGLKHADRIRATAFRKYIATVSQVLFAWQFNDILQAQPVIVYMLQIVVIYSE
jgi:hypothetical protein